jgi:hypothetical protein
VPSSLPAAKNRRNTITLESNHRDCNHTPARTEQARRALSVPCDARGIARVAGPSLVLAQSPVRTPTEQLCGGLVRVCGGVHQYCFGFS